jgi:hypothetical protein
MGGNFAYDIVKGTLSIRTHLSTKEVEECEIGIHPLGWVKLPWSFHEIVFLVTALFLQEHALPSVIQGICVPVVRIDHGSLGIRVLDPPDESLDAHGDTDANVGASAVNR